MIEPGTGNLLASDAEALVNTVNTVGVMGKGIALQFKNAYPENYKAYVAACKRGEVVPGRMFVHETGVLGGSARFIINFPTKRHWKGKSRLEDIESGLEDLVRALVDYKIESVAIPPLGCGNGGLDWHVVEPMIREALAQVPEVRVFLHAPDGTPANDEMLIATKPPALTDRRAAMIAVLGQYLVPDYRLTSIEAQKLAYFLQASGFGMKLNFVKHQFGPYADNLNHALQALEGHYLRGYGDRNSQMALHLLPEAAERAAEHLSSDATAAAAVRSVAEIVRGYETPYGLELLATTHWAVRDLGTSDVEAVVRYVQEWTPRKGQIFTKAHITKALKRLHATGLIEAEG
ncbi:O-acetyl-ADP-ribose deacetylase (regulator of RNase III), contains Macro domain [Blastococcus aggregatus]|uniref:O-acetyl-ADP-ribose deacetylase (Regulator of RNase III), contains Macro domain n=1 Tax=Blastococcus aggregatus TaxID=38502 RepID=A0A285UY35_9ACTN|nr:macro domain-containing protein [Blastococcus aggregatus]SOC46597.1 O-acetyl-ADP-ribose deacetylase (regulator of RNase III), contains Macro domain [Blastococcus aggregatus]